MAPLSASASTPPAVSSKGLSWPYYLLGVSALIPYLGVLTGIAAFILGILNFKRGGWILLILALLGFAVTGGVSYFAYYQMFVNRSGTMGTIWVKATQDQLTLLVKDIEFYKLSNGHYPAALSDLPADAKKRTFDIMAMNGDFKNIKYVNYVLMPDGQTYYLFSSGADGTSFTADDIFPKIDPAEAGKFGYRERPLNPGAAVTPANP